MKSKTPKLRKKRGYYRSIYLSVTRTEMIEELCKYYQTNVNDLCMQLIDAEHQYLSNKGEL